MYRAIIILLISFVHIQLFSQTVTYNHDDSITYNLYMSKSWDKLIDYTDKVEENSESYYTAFRIGAAYFEKEQYMPALEYFEKALKQNKNDELAKEYLYYSYLYSGRESDANVKASSFSPSLKKKLKYSKPSFFSGFSTEGGYFINNGFDEQKKVNTIGSYNIFGTQTLLKNYYYANVSFSHSIGTKLSLFHGFSYFNYTLTQQFTEKNNKVTDINAEAKQKDYYFSFNYNLNNGLDLNGGFHYLNSSGTYTDYNIDGSNNNITYDYKNYTSSVNEFALSFSLEKSISNAKLSASASISNLNMAKQFQSGLSITFFPLGNLNLYGYVNSQYCSNTLETGVNQDHFVVTPGLGFKISDYLWLEAYYTFGSIFNYNENNALIIYNNVSRINRKLNVKALLPIVYNKLDFSLSFEYYNLRQSYFTYTNTSDYFINFNDNKNIKLIGGIKWSF